ncbi:hypothetical protein [Paenibacillus beijingensis]|uniref:Pyridoxamine 5'-phosphate oxidase putative domain-containing protein n=1 Tax=Paenibacillus beijingensis TaxID=1126833 RepID=A0A0D5NG88_9BACL|nr:hypothetical protein [Paenibacillus beijingensis]AJY73992.1 hypothetical protein VN24_04420 [Paenibacillus beijingensis]
MDTYPAELFQFLERLEPIYIHAAVANRNGLPLSCRGYGVREHLEHELVWIYILTSQWLRIQPYLEHQPWLAVLLTSGVDNESFQLKGTFAGCRALAEDDCTFLERSRNAASQFFPHLAALQVMNASDCLAIGMKVKAVYLQTPGPHAGSLLMERR